MSKFDFMAFSYDAGPDEMFVAHAGKYSTEETVELCKRECEYSLQRRKLREPTVNDVFDAWCGYRYGVSSEWPHGCYTFVGEKEIGAFPVHVIEFNQLKQEAGQ